MTVSAVLQRPLHWAIHRWGAWCPRCDRPLHWEPPEPPDVVHLDWEYEDRINPPRDGRRRCCLAEPGERTDEEQR